MAIGERLLSPENNKKRWRVALKKGRERAERGRGENENVLGFFVKTVGAGKELKYSFKIPSLKTDPILYKGDQLKLRIFLKLSQNWDAINENSTQRFAN